MFYELQDDTLYNMTDLIPELTYYIRWAEYIEKLQKRGAAFSKAKVVNSAYPVSYTHLDVYKRQVVVRGAVLCEEDRGNAGGHHYGEDDLFNVIRAQPFLMIGKCFGTVGQQWICLLYTSICAGIYHL